MLRHTRRQHVQKNYFHNLPSVQSVLYRKLTSHHTDRQVVAISEDHDQPLPTDRDPGETLPVYNLAMSSKLKRKILACDEIGNVWLFHIAVDEKIGLCTENNFHAHSRAPIHDVIFVNPEQNENPEFATISSDGHVYTWNFDRVFGRGKNTQGCTQSDFNTSANFDEHEPLVTFKIQDRIKAIRAPPTNSYDSKPYFSFVTGCGGNIVNFWDTRIKTAAMTQELRNNGDGITAIEFNPTNSLVYIGQACQPDILVMDFRYLKPPPPVNSPVKKGGGSNNTLQLASIKYQGENLRTVGYSALQYDLKNNRLFASCTDDTIYALKNDKCVGRYNGHRNNDYFNTIDVKGDYLVSGSGFQTIKDISNTPKYSSYMWDISKVKTEGKQAPIIELAEGHDKEVRCVQFCPDGLGGFNEDFSLVTASDDGSVRLWRPDFGGNDDTDSNSRQADCRVVITENTEIDETNTDDVENRSDVENKLVDLKIKSPYRPFMQKNLKNLKILKNSQTPNTSSLKTNKCKNFLPQSCNSIQNITTLLKNLPCRIAPTDISFFATTATPMKKRQFQAAQKKGRPKNIVQHFAPDRNRLPTSNSPKPVSKFVNGRLKRVEKRSLFDRSPQNDVDRKKRAKSDKSKAGGNKKQPSINLFFNKNKPQLAVIETED